MNKNQVNFNNITFKCNPDSTDEHNKTYYHTKLENSVGLHTYATPIIIEQSSLSTTNSIFENCRNSMIGGVIYLENEASYKDNGSVFRYKFGRFRRSYIFALFGCSTREYYFYNKLCLKHQELCILLVNQPL